MTPGHFIDKWSRTQTKETPVGCALRTLRSYGFGDKPEIRRGMMCG